MIIVWTHYFFDSYPVFKNLNENIRVIRGEVEAEYNILLHYRKLGAIDKE